jgi:hypothetical protein
LVSASAELEPLPIDHTESKIRCRPAGEAVCFSCPWAVTDAKPPALAEEERDEIVSLVRSEVEAGALNDRLDEGLGVNAVELQTTAQECHRAPF